MTFAGINASLSGMQAAVVRQTLAAHNVANVSSIGFKGARARAVAAAFGGVASTVRHDMSQGPLETATNAFALAVEGPGLIPVETPAGLRYTRAGLFGLDAGGSLVTPQGHRPSPPIQIPPEAIGFEVSADGAVRALMPDGAVREAGRLALALFPNPEGLVAEGAGLFAPGPASGAPEWGVAGQASFGRFVPGAIEGANVDLARETVESILATRTFQFNAAAFSAADEALGALLDIRR